MASLLTPEDKLGMPLETIIANDASTAASAGEGAGGSAAGSTAEGTGNNRRVYVGNLSWGTAWQGLKDHMKQAGEVTRADVLQDGQGRSKGCGLVEFKTAAQARNAILTLNNTELDGRQIFIREDREAGNDDGHSASGSQAGRALDPAKQAQRVYVGNLSWNVDREQLRQHMAEAGEVTYAEVLTEPSGRSKGCGIVEYASQEQAQAAIERLHNTQLNGRPIFVREDRESGAGSSSGGGGGGGHAPVHHQGYHPHPHAMHMHHPHPAAAYHPHAAMHAHPHAHYMTAGPPVMRGGRGGHAGGGGPVSTRVYVGNLSYEVAWQDLKDHMRKVGNVVHADVLEDHEGRSKGCGIVEYDNPHAALRAIRELNNTDLKGRLIFVREDREDKKITGGFTGGHGGGGGGGGAGRGPPPSAAGRQLYVGNLDFEVTWQDLKDHFKGFEVQRAEVAYDQEGRSKGYGTVRFATAPEAQRAMEAMNGTQLGARSIEVREDARA